MPNLNYNSYHGKKKVISDLVPLTQFWGWKFLQDLLDILKFYMKKDGNVKYFMSSKQNTF